MRDHPWLTKKPESIGDWLSVIFTCAAFYMILKNIGALAGGISTLAQTLSPFAGGVVIAYILDAMVRFFQKRLFRGNKKLRWISILMAYAIAVLIIVLLIWLVVPQLVSSIASLFSNIPYYVESVQSFLLHLQTKYDIQLTNAIQAMNDYGDLLTNFAASASTSWLPQIMGYAQTLASNFVAIFTAIAASVYMLADKDHLLHQLRTLTRAVLPGRAAEKVLEVCHYANDNFTGFFIGKIIDSAIIGVLTFVCMSFLRLDYALLISVFVGITNIIPVFGPFIGAIPGIIILLFIAPIQALIFAVLILIIQQVDGNFIGPKILGKSIGVSAFWILFAIVVGGDLWGLAGMVVGVPLFATLYGLAQELVHAMLHNRGIDAEGRPLPAEAPADEEVYTDEEAPLS